ncbi:hypothetical protein BS47DRAFT_1360435 [Hydnum rufescens UP504]|uniref:Uncharacterized protein n=1 Tax=Hydnum rufescens UP504 TaxID=1448309 RepID=A0A9P6B4M9_9AGAM|nr:hypothetical protein BS47DRAFT_1360435 [Hydnum rufescens UP504]
MALCQTYVVPGFRWVYEYGERIKVYDNEEDDPTFSTPKPAASSGVDDDDGMDIFGAIMGNLSTQNSMTLTDAMMKTMIIGENHPPWILVKRMPTKALISLQKMGMIAMEVIHERREATRERCKAVRSRLDRAKDYAEADRSRNELEAIEKSKAEELRREAETHVREVKQREREASQSRQSAPTVSSAPPPPPPPPTPSAPSSPCRLWLAQHAPTASTTGPASLPPRPPAPAPDFLILVLSPCLEKPPRAPRGMLIPPRGHWEPQGSKNGDMILLHHCGTIGANEIGTEPPKQAGSSRGLSESLRHPAGRRSSLSPLETYSVEDTTTSTTLSVPTTMLRSSDSTKTTALPISTKTIPVSQELMGHDHCKVEGDSPHSLPPPPNSGLESRFDSLSGRTIVYSQAEAKFEGRGHNTTWSLVNNQVESFQYENDLVNCLGVMEVRYMQEAYINAHSMAEVKELLAIGSNPLLDTPQCHR